MGRTESIEASSSKEEMIVQSPLEQCSDLKDDCSATKCCKVSGFDCFEKNPGTYRCSQGCDPKLGWTCKMPRGIGHLLKCRVTPPPNPSSTASRPTLRTPGAQSRVTSWNCCRSNSRERRASSLASGSMCSATLLCKLVTIPRSR